MAKIKVKVRSDKGELGTHLKFGALIPGATMTIEEEDFGAELFERPHPDFLSPHEQADRVRAGELGQRVGHQDPPAEPAEETPKENPGEQKAPMVPPRVNNGKGVKDNA